MIYTPFNQSIKKSVRYKKIKAVEPQVKKIIDYYLDRTIYIDEFHLRIGHQFEMNNKVYEVINTKNNNDSDMINCKVIYPKNSSETNNIHEYDISLVIRKVKYYYS